MGGAESIRGYYFQVLSCLLDSLDTDNKWEIVSIEHTFESDTVKTVNTVDIYWYYEGKAIKVVQVKSTKNQINVPDLKNWADLLKKSSPTAADWEIISFGPVSQGVLELSDWNSVKIRPPAPLDPKGILKQTTQSLEQYLENINESVPSPSGAFLLVKALLTDLILLPIERVALSRKEFDDKLRNYTRLIIPREDNRNKHIPELEISFDNDQDTLEINKKPPLLNGLIEESDLDKISNVTEMERESYNEKVRKYNEELKKLSSFRKIVLMLRNIGGIPATNIDINLMSNIEPGIKIISETNFKDLLPIPPLKSGERLDPLFRLGMSIPSIGSIQRPPPNVTYSDIQSEVQDNSVRWWWGYHIDNLKHNDYESLYPFFICIPENIRAKQIVFQVNITLQEPVSIPDCKLIIDIID